jgi:hypothetical protein
VIAVSGSSGVTSVTPHGLSGSLLFSFGLFSGTTAGQTCCVTDTASSNGFDPYRRVVVLVVYCGASVGSPGGGGVFTAGPPCGYPNG